MNEVMLIKRENAIEVIPPKQMLSSKDVMLSIDNFSSQIEKQEHDVKQMLKGMANAKEAIENNKKYLKKIQKHQEWALADQDKLIRNLVTKDLIEKTKVNFKLETDETLSDEKKKSANYYRFKREVMKIEEIQSKIHVSVIEKKANEDDLIPNHF